MAAPVMTTTNTVGNLLASSTIASGGTANVTFNVDNSAKFAGFIQIAGTFNGSATKGIQIDAFRRIGSGPVTDGTAFRSIVLPQTTTMPYSFPVDTGRFTIKITNLDTAQSITVVTATSDTIDSVS